MDIFAGANQGRLKYIMHNITKIKLFRILLRITYLPSLIIMLPLAMLKKKSRTGLFFFFDRYAMGGAQRIHLDILKSIPEIEKQVFFTRYSPNDIFRREFYDLPNSQCKDIHILCDYLLIRLFSVHYFSFYLNRHKSVRILGSNSTFFYDMLPFLSKNSIRIELLHNFTFGKKGMEFFGLKNYHLLNYRIIYDYYTKDNIEKQYKAYQIDPEFMKHILFIEPGVTIPPEKKKSYTPPLKIICAGRGGAQKRIQLVNKIAENLIDQHANIEFHFAGTLINELSSKVKINSLIHGEISDPAIMSILLSEMNIALLTSSYEGFPMFIKEAMANGCIPVVTALPGNLMHLKDGYNCLLIEEIFEETEVVSQGTKIIERLLGDSTLCIQLSEGAYHYASLHFSRTQFNAQYRKLLLS
jgi:glycosyltransferase involved in cell wall biosynthesis